MLLAFGLLAATTHRLYVWLAVTGVAGRSMVVFAIAVNRVVSAGVVARPAAVSERQMMRPISRYSWRAASTRSAVVIGRCASAAISAARRAAFLM